MDKLRSGSNKTLSSKLKWQKDYDKENMKVTGIKHSMAERSMWEKSAEEHGIKLSSFVRLCVMYCIKNNIDVTKNNTEADFSEKAEDTVKNCNYKMDRSDGMSIFSTEGKLYKFMSRFTDVVVLNFLWVLCSLPVVTVGVSTIAACSVTIKMCEDREGKIAGEFFREFKANFKQGLPMSFISIVSIWAVYLDLQLVSAAEEHVILFVITATVAIYILGFSQLYVYPLLARYRNTIFCSLRNSFSISMKYFFRSLMLIFLIAVEVALILWNSTTLFVGVLIGPAIIMYTVSGIAIGIFRELEKLPETVVDRSAEEKFDDM